MKKALIGVNDNTVEMIGRLSPDAKELMNDLTNSKSKKRQLLDGYNLAKRFLPSPKEIPYFYHYTSIKALDNILNSKLLYFSSIHDMNDKEEMKYTIKIAINILKKYKLDNNELSELINFLHNVPTDIYIMSFSANDHSQALSQYGELALKMDNQNIQNIVGEVGAHGKVDPNTFENGDFYVFPLKVEYNEKKQIDMISLIIDSLISSYMNISIDKYDMSEIMHKCKMSLFLLSLAFKNPLLKQEEEIRYVILNDHPGHDINYETIFSDKRSMIIPFNNKKILEEVIYSHKAKSKKDEIRQILDKNDLYYVKSKLTKLPY